MAVAAPVELEPLALDVGPHTFDALAAGPVTGDLVLLLHGFPQTEVMWTPVLRALGAAGYRVVAPRQRGYAESARPAGRSAYRIEELVGDVVGFADALDADRFHLVGHDWGGVVGWEVAADVPERVRSFSSLSTPHPAAIARSMVGLQAIRSLYAGAFQLPVVPELVLGAHGRAPLRWMLERSGLPDDDVRACTAALDEPALHAALQWYRATSPLRLARARPVRVPTTFVWGNGDAALGRVAAESTSRFVHADYRFVELDASHWLVETRTDDVVSLIREQLEGAANGSPARSADS
jgi:pimeloyl-ACP methyl ester carboxylesterase